MGPSDCTKFNSLGITHLTSFLIIVWRTAISIPLSLFRRMPARGKVFHQQLVGLKTNLADPPSLFHHSHFRPYFFHPHDLFPSFLCISGYYWVWCKFSYRRGVINLVKTVLVKV